MEITIKYRLLEAFLSGLSLEGVILRPRLVMIETEKK